MVIALLTARELPARVAHSLPDAWRTRRGRPQPAGVNGIPHSFVVGRDNRILFSGHPMDPNFDAAIRKGVAAAAGPPPTPVAQSARVTDPIKATREELLAMSAAELKSRSWGPVFFWVAVVSVFLAAAAVAAAAVTASRS